MVAGSNTTPPPSGGIEIVEPLCAVFRRHLRSEGQKYTPERARILDAIIDRDGLFQADDLLDSLRDGEFRVSKATVYRTIKLLQDSGIIQRVPFGDGQAHYLLIYGRSPQDLIIDVESGRVIPVQADELEEIKARLCAEHGLEPRGHRLQIFAAPSSEG
ncbi:MAG: Fur family transcriptional regulator [Planctomycetota bacterium]